ncbi:hypothetical protein [Winogradskyella flava]|uniref:Major facilitator superfamily (MFS) profile domain-containing protein n=1 Tax=Winogradskyella flava TaxID=1884876 RepID=A0A842IKX8_9FLAO|nr:hypothetical protein [Winogradskyella flava]MBC2843922.1 hypothetical protein [Winogradskyella flava]
MGVLIDSTDYGWYILLLFFLAFGVPLLLLIIGLVIRPKNKKASTIILIIAAVYSVIGLGVCRSVLI